MTDDRGNMSFSDPQLEFFNFDALSDDEVQRIKNVLKQPCSAVELPDFQFSSSAKDQVNGVQTDYKSVPVAIMDYNQVASTYATMAQPHMYSVASTVNGTTYITGYAVPGTNLYVASTGRKDYLIPKMMNGIDGVENGGGGSMAEQVVDANGGVAGMVVSSNIYPAPPWAYPCPTYVLPTMPTFFTPIAPVHAAGIRAPTSTVTMCGESVIPSTIAPPPMPSPTAYVAVAAAPVPIQSSVVAEAAVLQQSSMPAEIVSSLDQNCEQSYAIDEVYYEKTPDSFEAAVADEGVVVVVVYEKEEDQQVADNYEGQAEESLAASQREVEELKPSESEQCVVEVEVEAVVAAVSTPSVTPPVNVEVARPAAVNKTWASLFKSKAQHSAPHHHQQQPSPPVVTPTAVPPNPPQLTEAATEKNPMVSVNDRNSAATPANKAPTTANANNSPKVDYCHTNGLVKEPTSSDRSLGELLLNMKVDQRPVNFSPRGLLNKGNWCYINATLQALLACPPFYNLLCKLPNVVGLQQGKTNSPITDCMVEFVHEFSPSNNVGGVTTAARRKDDQPPVTIGHHFEPTYIYNIMSKLRSDSFEGRQEDAEEFLSCLLNGLHEEMLAAISSVESSDKENNEEEVMELVDEDDESWKVIEKGNKSSVTRSATFSSSPVSDIFCGSIRSALHAVSISSTTLQPFFSLQLDIQSENVRSVKEALLGLVTKETLQGYHCSKTKQEVAASRQMTLEELPPILILHLKRFVYNKDGGCQKLSKRLDFKINLEFGKELLSSTAKNKLGSSKHKHYKLIAVVYHCGREAVKGHYIADVYHHGSSAWLRADDTRMTVVQESEVLNHPNVLVPYLLFYRRLDGVVTNSTGNVK